MTRAEWLELIDSLKPGPELWHVLHSAVKAGAISKDEALSMAGFWGNYGRAVCRAEWLADA